MKVDVEVSCKWLTTEGKCNIGGRQFSLLEDCLTLQNKPCHGANLKADRKTIRPIARSRSTDVKEK